jgi:hypothetical protein
METGKANRFISPPREELSNLRTTLTNGEWEVFNFFDKHLSNNWEIYVQPHLNGLRPDFVLLNAAAGIAVFEVKDWDIDLMSYFVKRRDGKPPILLATDNNGITFSLQAENPVERIYRYKNEIYNLYCPRLKNRLGFSVITAGIIFPFSNSEEVYGLLKQSREYRNMHKVPHYYPVVGVEEISSGDLCKVFPEARRKNPQLMNEDIAKDLKNWLVEPDFAAGQRQPLLLNDDQKRLVTTRTQSGYRRIKGPAGSGKSMVLAARAAKLISEKKTVLVITYNITLWHYLMDIAVRWPRGTGNTRRDITWLNFHYWCRRVCEESDSFEEYKDLWKSYFDSTEELFDAAFEDNPNLHKILNEDIPNLVSQIIDKDGEHLSFYDAILVDEGQDMLPIWWNVLRKVCKPGGEMLLAADATQDIYGTARSWTDEAMIGAGFPGGLWSTLNISYRLPPTVAEKARQFAQQFLPKDLIDLPFEKQGELELFPCNIRWIQTSEEKAIEITAEAILDMPLFADPNILVIPDITFLSPSHKNYRKQRCENNSYF